jgi:hypothetical protein
MDRLTEAQRGKMRHALGLDRARKSYRNRYYATFNSADCDLWTDLVSRGYAALVNVEGTSVLFMVTEAGREALGSQPTEKR